jgi:hypothetical protein
MRGRRKEPGGENLQRDERMGSYRLSPSAARTFVDVSAHTRETLNTLRKCVIKIKKKSLLRRMF